MSIEDKEKQEDKNIINSWEQEKLSNIDEKTAKDKLLPMLNKIKSKINPYNRWVEDYSDKWDFKSAYALARKNWEKEFMYKDKRYNTNYNWTPEQQLKITGITDEQLQNKNIIQNRLANNLAPVGYEKPIKRFIEAVIENKTDLYRNTVSERRMDAYRLYMWIPQMNNTFAISKYVPNKSKNKNVFYYSIQDNDLKNKLLNIISKENDLMKYREYLQKNELALDNTYSDVMGKFLFDVGSDNNGEYISYYDKWDISILNKRNPITGKEITTDFGRPFEIYDRIYYRENPEYYLPKYENAEKEMLRLKSIVSSSEYDSKWNPVYKDKNWSIVKFPKEYIYYIDYENYLYKIMSDRPPKYIIQYFSNNELKELDINRKDFSVLELQKELSNRWYDLLNSRKQDWSLDWVLWDETKNALLDWKNKN